MSTLYENFLAGTTTDNPLSDSATTINSSGFSSLPEVTGGDEMYITLDPDASAGAPEIVKVTAHSTSATSVTVTRAQQSTSAREHASGTTWRHSFTKTDAERVGTPDDDAVTTAKINDGAVTTAKLGADAVTGAKIADDAVDSEHLAAGGIDTEHLADDAVTDAKIGAPSTGTLDSSNIYYARYGNLVTVWTAGATSGATLPVGYRPVATVQAPSIGVLGGSATEAGKVSISTGGVISDNHDASVTGHFFCVTFSTV